MGGVTQADISTAAYTVETAQKVAAAYQASNFAICLNGGTVATDTSGTVPTVDRLLIGGQAGASTYLNGYFMSLDYYPSRISNSSMQAATT